MRCDIRQIPSDFGQFRNGSPRPPSTPFLAEWAEIFSPWNLPPDAQKLHRLPNWSTAAMEKTIAPWSYWLGITSVIVAIAWKGENIFGLWASAAANTKRHLILVVFQCESPFLCGQCHRQQPRALAFAAQRTENNLAMRVFVTRFV